MNIIAIASHIMPLSTIHSVVDSRTVASGIPAKKADQIREAVAYPFKMVEAIEYLPSPVLYQPFNYINGKRLPKRKTI